MKCQLAWLWIVVACCVIGCTPSQNVQRLVVNPDQTNAPGGNKSVELILYDWFDDIPDNILSDFITENELSGIRRLTYESAEEAAITIREGLDFDVAVVESDYIPGLVEQGSLLALDPHRIRNMRHIAVDFRDLAYDPDNRYSVPYTWGTTGLLVRSDRITGKVSRWADLWKPEFQGKVALRRQPTELISVALKSLGYPLNSEDPQALEAALQHLIQLKLGAFFVETDAEAAIEAFLNSPAVIMVGWPEDALLSRDYDPAIQYIIPEEGSMLWSDNLVISASSVYSREAELFIDYLMRPEVNARIVNECYYSTANEAAISLVKDELLSNPIIFPSIEELRRSEWYMPLSPAGQLLYADIWQRFLEASD